MRPSRILPLILVLTFLSCSKDEPTSGVPGTVEHMDELNVSQQFDWSASLQGNVNVQFNNPDNLSLNKEFIQIIDDQDRVIAKTQVENGLASFSIKLPANANYRLFFPSTGSVLAINGPGNYTLPIGSQKGGKKLANTNDLSACTDCVDPVLNGGFENPQTNPDWVFNVFWHHQMIGWKTDHDPNYFQVNNGRPGRYVQAQEGLSYLEIQANDYCRVWQDVCTTPGSTITWSIWHRGLHGTDVGHVKIGADTGSATLQQIMTTGQVWTQYTGTYTVPAGQTTTAFIFQAISAANNQYGGNLIDNFQLSCDNDGDGISNSLDDFPNDSLISSISYYPSSGRELVLFEDLWPAKGDYDFNDLVLSQKVEIARNANSELVRADFTVAIDAIGAGLSNGVGLLLRDQNGQNLPANIVNAINGDIAVDNDNTNGFILTNDVFDFCSTYYTNNGIGPSGTPDTLKFSIAFKPGETVNFIPELYMFRTNQRGLEIHRPGFAGSAAFDNSLANTMEDNGNYRTAEGLPWAMEIISSQPFDHPLEKVDMIVAYPQFQVWATSMGSQNATWYDSPASAHVFGGN